MAHFLKITLLFFICTIRIANAGTSIGIDKALKNKLITAVVICKGGLSVNYNIKNETKDSLIIFVPAGWRMNSVKEEYQDILVTREQILALGKQQQKSFVIKGYCCEADHSGPKEGTKYECGKMADSTLTKIARYLNLHRNDENTEQYAVWAVSNNNPTSHIVSSNDSLSSQLRNYVSVLKGEPVPWYTLLKRVIISRTGNINEYPVQLKGKVNYAVRETVYAYFFILDSGGTMVGVITGQWLTPGIKEYVVNVNVKDFKKGKYKIILSDKEQEYIAKEFEI